MIIIRYKPILRAIILVCSISVFCVLRQLRRDGADTEIINEDYNMPKIVVSDSKSTIDDEKVKLLLDNVHFTINRKTTSHKIFVKNDTFTSNSFKVPKDANVNHKLTWINYVSFIGIIRKNSRIVLLI